MLLSGYYGIMVFAQKSRPIAGGVNEKSGHAPIWNVTATAYP